MSAPGARRRNPAAQDDSFIELVSDAIVVSDRAGRIVLVNAAAERRFGYGRAELLGQPVEMLLPDGLYKQHVAHRVAGAADVAEKPASHGGVYRSMRKNGQVFLAEISLHVTGRRSPRLVTAVIRDATAHQAPTTVPETRAQHLQTLPDASDDFVFLLDREQRYVELFSGGFERVIANLLDNAIKYSPQGNEVVEQHGGTITVASGEAGGTAFTIRLPLTEPCGGAPCVTVGQRE